jgi:uncharacterized protein (TIGR02266 family)
MEAGPESDRRKKVLLVDDAELFLDLGKQILFREDVEVLVAHSGREALAMVRDRRPDLIFLDLNMPEMGGEECCRILKANTGWKAIPVVMVTSCRDEKTISRCLEGGCADIVFKPLDRRKMIDIAERLLNLRRVQANRIPARLRIRFGTGGTESLTDYSVNLSTGGVFIETVNILPEDTALKIDFLLPEGNVVRCRGRVAWNNPPARRKSEQLPPGMGIQFLDLSLADLALVRDYVETRSIEPV